MAFATLADLEEALGESPEEGDDEMLDAATDLLAYYLQSALYDVDTAGNATDSFVVAAFKKACVEQVRYWKATGDRLNLQEFYSTLSLGPATLSRTSGTSLPVLAPAALRALRSTPNLILQGTYVA